MKACRADANAPQAVKELTDEMIEAFKDGFALAATQAAIWKFGNNSSGDVSINIPDTPINYYGQTSGKVNADDMIEIQNGTKEASQRQVANALYQLLISDYLMNKTKENSQGATDLIQLDDITEASITVKDKVDTDKLDAAVKKALAESGNNVYNTDFSFTMAVVPSKETDDILVRIYCGGEVIATRRLAGQNSEGETYEMLLPDENGTYVIQNIQLPEGMEIRLELKGAQQLAPGVYLYQSKGMNEDGVEEVSQNFIGLSTKSSTRELLLNVIVEFEVTDAQQLIETENKAEKSKKVWTESVVKVTEVSDPQIREVPVYAKSPKTGDSAVFWHFPMMLLAGGMLVFAEIKRKKTLHS